MIDTHDWHRYGQAVGGRVWDTLRRSNARPRCPRCLSNRSIGIVRIEIEELPGLPIVEQRDWQCRTCLSLVRETIPA